MDKVKKKLKQELKAQKQEEEKKKQLAVKVEKKVHKLNFKERNAIIDRIAKEREEAGSAKRETPEQLTARHKEEWKEMKKEFKAMKMEKRKFNRAEFEGKHKINQRRKELQHGLFLRQEGERKA